MYTDVYTGSLQTQSYIQSSHKPLRKSTKQSHLDHLHHNQEIDFDPLKTHTSLGQYTNTKIADLDPLKNTQQISANTQRKLVQQSTRITLITEDNLKSIQAESYSTHFEQSQTLSNLSSLKNSIKKSCYSNLFFWIYSKMLFVIKS